MPKTILEPTREPGEASYMGDKLTHPAFATISAHRISGQFSLFASNVGHSGAVMIELNEATMYEDGHSQCVHGACRPIARAYLSEAQWVAFISRMNMGSGTPCTMAYYRGGELIDVPELPNPEKPAERLRSQAQDMLNASQKKQTEAADRLAALIGELKVPAKAKAELLNQLGYVVDHGQVNRDYQKKVLDELNEKLITDARIELDAMVTDIVTRLGVSSIKQLAQLAADQERGPHRPALEG